MEHLDPQELQVHLEAQVIVEVVVQVEQLVLVVQVHKMEHLAPLELVVAQEQAVQPV
jgi:hypothetical protein